jgi:iron complex outermembrane recepter protein
MSVFIRALGKRRPLVFLCYLLCLLGGNAASVAQTADQPLQISIPAGDLADALEKLGDQSGVQIMYEPTLVAGIKAPAVSGRLTVGDALAKLLARTGLEANRVNDKTVVLKRAAAKKVSEKKPLDPPPTAAASSEEPELADVVVTARRREESAQKVPIAVTVISDQVLQDNNAVSLSDLTHLAPSLSMVSAIHNRDSVNVSIRGQGSNTFNGAPGVVSYLNDVPIPGLSDGELAGGPGLLFDLENVQVLKGPQGTLFGKNSVGGALLLQTARPTNDLGGHVQVGYGNYNNVEADAAVNIPIISDVLLTRVAFNGDTRDGFTRLLGAPSHPNGLDVDDRHYWSVRGTVTFRPNDDFQNDTILTYQDYWDHGSPFLITTYYPGGFLEGLFPAYGAAAREQLLLGARTAVASSVDPVSKGTFLSVNDIARVNFTDALTFRNIFGYGRTTTTTTDDRDSSIAPLFDTPNVPQHETIRQITEEAQLLGKAFGERLDWIAGVFFLDSRDPTPFLGEGIVFDARMDSITQNKNRSKALFAQGTYDLSSFFAGLSVTGGLRYTWDSQTNVAQGGDPALAPLGVPVVCTEPSSNCGTVLSHTTDFSALTWTTGLNYQATRNTLLYFANRRGYRAGGANATAAAPDLPDFGPEFVTDFEVGVKSDWLLGDMPVRTNAALYYQDYTDIQLQTIFVDVQHGGTPTPITGNAGKARIWGAELEAQLQLTKDLRVGLTFDHLDFKLTDAGGTDPVTLLSELGPNGKGERPPYKYGVDAHYSLPLSPALGRVSVSGNWSWQAASGAPEIFIGGEIPAYGVLNLAANWDSIGGGPLDASFYMSNATDKLYRIGGISNASIGFFNAYRFSEPRMYGIRFKYRFGAER